VAASNSVFFGAVQAIVTSASASNLAVMVPAGATLAPITVTVNGRTGSSSGWFVPTFHGDDSPVSFGPLLYFDVGLRPNFVAIADLDGDGRPSVATVNGDDRTVSVFRNLCINGVQGTASSPMSLPAGFL